MSAFRVDRRDTRPVQEQSVDWVSISPRNTPGWPWPEESYGLGPMYGDDGWCRGCGTSLVEQSGPLVMQGSKFPTADVWMPNWLFDVVCVSGQTAADIAQRFSVDLGEVHKPRKGPTGVQQILPALTVDPWRRPQDLAAAVRTRHSEYYGDRTGSTCATCDRWKWLPISEHEAPMIASALNSTSDVIASPEVFGDGLKAFRHLLFRRPLGETLVAVSPRNWALVEVEVN